MKVRQCFFLVELSELALESEGQGIAYPRDPVLEFFFIIHVELVILRIFRRRLVGGREEFKEPVLEEFCRLLIEDEIVIRVEMELALIVVAPFVIEFLGQGDRHV